MLSWACRRFRARFTPGVVLPHRRACADCAAYAAAVEQAAGARLPLPASLRRNLKALAGGTDPGAVLSFRVPRLAVPDDLVRRLRTIGMPTASARSSQPAPPEWVRSPRAAIAASIVLALLFGPLLAGAADRGEQALRLADQEVAPLVSNATAEGHEALGRLSLAAGTAMGSAWATVWGEARELAAKSIEKAQAGLSGLSSRSTRLFKSLPHPDPRPDAAGDSRRSR